MNQFGKIIVHIDDSNDCDIRLNLARQIVKIGEKLTSRLALPPIDVQAVYATSPNYLSPPVAYPEYDVGAMSLLIKADQIRYDEAKIRFDQWSVTPGSKISWTAMAIDFPENHLLKHVLLSDLVVLAQNNPADQQKSGVSKSMLSNLIITSGKPTLIVPYIGVMNSSLQKVMIAWKPTRESARALSASIPFLRTANSVHIVADVAKSDLESFKNRLTSYLVANGVTVSLTFQTSFGSDSGGEELLSAACDISADLLVMGCYGHGRMREFVLGGASRTILQSMTLPILMTH